MLNVVLQNVMKTDKTNVAKVNTVTRCRICRAIDVYSNKHIINVNELCVVV